jgi:hypothetical protein
MAAQDDDSIYSDDEQYLEPTPLAVQDAAYAGDGDETTSDLGFRFGRMRLGERIGGLYRPRIADEVEFDTWPGAMNWVLTAGTIDIAFSSTFTQP